MRRLLPSLLGLGLLGLLTPPASAADATLRLRANTELAIGNFSNDMSNAFPGPGIVLACLPSNNPAGTTVTVTYELGGIQNKSLSVGECWVFPAFGHLKLKTSTTPAVVELSV